MMILLVMYVGFGLLLSAISVPLILRKNRSKPDLRLSRQADARGPRDLVRCQCRTRARACSLTG